jgi:tetratricopeptide (TPR) repeat protein
MTNHTTHKSFLDLEIRIFPRQDENYPVEITLGSGEVFQGYLSTDVLPWISSGDLVKDGQKLFETLFKDQDLRRAWDRARDQSVQRRIRLRIAKDAPELHALPWELLHEGNTASGVMLSASVSTPFSRYLAVSNPWGDTVKERPVRVLAAISNPKDLEDKYSLSSLDMNGEQAILEEALSDLGKEEISLDFLGPPVTLVRIAEALQRVRYHILHYIGHGMFSDRHQQTALYLQNEEGNTRIVRDTSFVKMLNQQSSQTHLRLIFLAACQSATRSTADAFLGLAPRLVITGAPAVVAMQDHVAIRTTHELSRTFYRRLAEHGIVDCALNEARSILLTAGQPDAAVPVLFMHLKSGQLWEASETTARLPTHTKLGEIPYLHQLPVTAPTPPFHFTGRRQDLDALKNALSTGQAIALQGMGGIGKTVTALKLAAELATSFPGGVFWGALPDHDGNTRPILRAWGQSCGQDLSAESDVDVMVNLVRGALTERQRERGPLLIIVDDVRPNWLEAAQQLQRTLPAATPFLLTTRDETLATALSATIHHLGALPHDEAITLLMSHAGSEVVMADPQAAEALLKVVGYLPLAIELAGKRLELLARKRGYHLATLGEAVAQRATETLVLPGHPGLAATFAITYEDLPPTAQRVFRWLGVFAASPLVVTNVAETLEMSEADAETTLDALVLASLLTWGEREGTYTLHPLLRQYAQALLVEAGEADDAEQKHLACYLAFAQANAQAEPSAWDRLEQGLPNLLLTVKRAAEIKDSAVLISLEEALLHDSLFLNVRGYYREAVELFSQSLEVQELLEEQKNRPRTLNKLAWFHIRLGQYREAQKCAEEAHSLAVALKDQEQQADSSHYLGIIFEGQGKNEQALKSFEKELAIRRESGDPSRLANCLNSLGAPQELLGHYAEAMQYINEALAIYEEIDNQYGIAICTANRGTSSLYMGDYANAMHDFETAFHLSQTLQDQEGMAHNLLNQGMLRGYLGDYLLSLQSLEDSLSLWQEIGDKAGEAQTLNALAEVYNALGDYQQAMENLQIAGEQIREIGGKTIEIEHLGTLGAVHYEQGNYEEALKVYSSMEALAKVIGTRYFSVQSKLGLSQTCLARSRAKDLEVARRCAAEAVALCRESQLAGSEPRGHAYLAKANLLLGAKETALQNCQKAMCLLNKQKHVHGSEVEIYLTTIEVLVANGRENERRRCLEQAFDLVQATAAKIENETLRQSYLAIRVNRGIIEMWEHENSKKA